MKKRSLSNVTFVIKTGPLKMIRLMAYGSYGPIYVLENHKEK